MSVTQITDDNIDTGIDTSKCIGAIGAMDGSALTGINVGTSLLKYGFNPAVDTNPADGVGAIWINTATGQMFSCTDATTDQNTWTNMGSGDGHITYNPPPWLFQGRTHGYIIGNTWAVNIIQRFSYSSTTAGEDIGDINYGDAGAPMASNGYTHAYFGGGVVNSWAYAYPNISKFAWGSSVTCSNVGSLCHTRYGGSSHSSETYGFYAAGDTMPDPNQSKVDRVSHTSDGNSTDIGDVNAGASTRYGTSSTTHGYSYRTNYYKEIDTFSFASSNFQSTVAGYMYNDRGGCGTASSLTHGYSAGGHESAVGRQRYIDKFSFASHGTASNIGDISYDGTSLSGSSSETHGYSHGGYSGYKTITRWNYSNDSDIAYYGDLVHNSLEATGTQN